MSLVERWQQTCVDLGDYTRYLNQNCYIAQKQTIVMAECAKFTIRDDGSRHIGIRKLSKSSRQTTGNNCKTAFSLHVVDSVSDDYNF